MYKIQTNPVNIIIDYDLNKLGEMAVANVIQQFFYQTTSKETIQKIEASLFQVFNIKFNVEIIDSYNIKISEKQYEIDNKS